ncbi:hypothetical protein A3F03_00830 [Candidatus Roizmanbacteria bacterium RIFCSPHIGHO2_12_FULL_41_11]|uniref:Dihydrofolate reductase n=2 Tax=Candidatus Roizmaniibacteriota TaxID=1752723 RepID=A0A1F7I3N1_9BACT|nr:MAG: hypothetical protein A3F03_00830 [Candidatus Roizmanbacteria bacterium RIFCSPHIGHO2_12_FULL_41_11]
MVISVIAAISENRAIGKNNQLLFRIPEDLKRFKTITSGHPVIMGRKTFESIGQPLPGRTNIVVTHDRNFHAQGLIVVHSLQEAIKSAFAKATADKKEIFIIGGASIYAQALPLADKLYLTIIHTTVKDADAFFPDYSVFTKKISEEHRESNGYRYSFLVLTR